MQHFTNLINLASARLGANVLAANDEFFAPKENLIKPDPAVFIPDQYTDRGKWMDGWETRRRRTPGHDWCIVKLGLAGVIRSVLVDTAFFRGNYPSHCSLDACGVPDDTNVADANAAVTWHPVLPQSELRGDAENTFTVEDARRFTHVRFNIFPDGGVARLRVLGDALPDWTRALTNAPDLDLASVVNGAHVVDTSDRFFGEPANMLMPYAAASMADGWETRRRRGPGHDWSIVHLGIEGALRRIEVATTHFKGNYPESCSLEAAVIRDVRGGVSADSSTVRAHWSTVIPRTPLQPDEVHVFDAESSAPRATATHVRLNIFPDGGISRLRVIGAPTPDARRTAVLRVLNVMDEPEARATLANFLAAPAWVESMMRSRPFHTPQEVFAAAHAAAATLGRDDWLEAFRHHPRIGERAAERAPSSVAGAWSAHEQAGVALSAAPEVAALAEANRDYERRFGHVFIVSASGKTAGQMLSALRSRLSNDPGKELENAAAEQRTITRLRLEQVLG